MQQTPSPSLPPHPLMKLCDDPQFRLQVAPSSLCSDELQDVFVPHTRRHEHVFLVLPRLLVLSGGGRGGVETVGEQQQHKEEVSARTYLDGKDLDGHVFVQNLCLPDAAKAPPGFHLQQLQRLETQQGGGRGRPRILVEMRVETKKNKHYISFPSKFRSQKKKIQLKMTKINNL